MAEVPLLARRNAQVESRIQSVAEITVAEPREPGRVMLIVAAFSRWPEALGWARDNLQNRYGPTCLESPVFDFVETHYYDDEMGGGLKKTFYAFERLIDPTQLAAIKLATNELERQAATVSEWAAAKSGFARPLNLDPGYLNAGKWVLATTKDQAHRLLLGGGVYAEVTLRFEHGEYVPWPWTYPNYCRDDYRAFFKQARKEYHRILKSLPTCDSQIENQASNP
jgi:hypothetical protein